MEKNEKNGVFSRVRSRWRSIFSKKANPVKLRDCNRLTFERFLSDPDEQIGTILAQATVEPITLPNGGGIAYIQETTLYEEDPETYKPRITSTTSTALNSSRRFNRLSSGDLNVIRRMTEEIDFDLKFQNVIYDGNEITGEPDAENGVDRACFKPGPEYPTEQQMMFLKQCIKKIDSRPPNMYYLTNRWTVDNFEALFKYMIRASEDSVRDTLLSIEFRDCVVSLQSLYSLIEDYALFKGVAVHADYVYATVHSKKASLERKLRGAIEQFVEVESKVRQARISYTSTITISSPHTPNVAVVVRFCCRKPCNIKKGKKKRHVSVKVDHITGHRASMPAPEQRGDGPECECVEIPADEEPPAPRKPAPVATIVTDRQMMIEEEEVPLQLSYHVDENTGETLVDCDVEHEDADMTTDSTQNHEIHEYVEMFPTLLELFEKAGIKDKDENDEVDCEIPVSKYPKKPSFLGGVTMSADGCEDTRSMASSGESSVASEFVGTTDTSDIDSSDCESNSLDAIESKKEENRIKSDSCNKENEKIEENPKDD
uniref:SET domain-containing protein n=1 Tax=Caenorhabditis tropicalis TaxID=1561998 RepID=A0A1I7UC67_9PELO